MDEKVNTAPDVHERVKQALPSWKTGKTQAFLPTLREDVEVAFMDQEHLGWAAFLEGCQCQQQYYE